MLGDDHLFVDVEALRARGWTEALIAKFLGKADSMEPVSHWANLTGKRTYYLGRVQSAEASDAFMEAFRRSVARRKCDRQKVALFVKARSLNRDAVVEWEAKRTPEQVQQDSILSQAASMFSEARRRGYRTPHKA